MNKMIPEISSYGDNDSIRCIRVDIPDMTLFYSYTTVIGFYTAKTGRVVCENVWSNTTGKHLNYLEPDKKKRVKVDEFNRRLQEAVNTLFGGETC